MKVVDISNIEELVIAKLEIEKYLMSMNKIKEKLSLDEFITKYLDFSSNVFIYNYDNKETIYPFSIIDINSNKYIFVINENSTILNKFMKIMKDINFDFSLLKNIDYDKVNEEDYYFIIDNKCMKV